MNHGHIVPWSPHWALYLRNNFVIRQTGRHLYNKHPVFQDNMGKRTPERLNQSGF